MRTVAGTEQAATGFRLATDGPQHDTGGRTTRQEQRELTGPGVSASGRGRPVSETLHIRPAVPEATKARRHNTAHLLKHLGEMTVAMMLGMAMLGVPSELAFDAAGIDYDRIELEWPTVPALVMAFNMIAPMVWWMRRRGHSWSYTLEMAAAMFVPVRDPDSSALAGPHLPRRAERDPARGHASEHARDNASPLPGIRPLTPLAAGSAWSRSDLASLVARLNACPPHIPPGDESGPPPTVTAAYLLSSPS